MIKDARGGERYGEWIERIGWEKFFEMTGLEFTDKHIDDFTFSVKNIPYRQWLQIYKISLSLNSVVLFAAQDKIFDWVVCLKWLNTHMKN